jgi:hypothetical protein
MPLPIGGLIANPAKGVKLHRRTRKPTVYLAHLAEEAKQYRALVLVWCYLGPRWGEAAAIRVRRSPLRPGRGRVRTSSR